MSKNESLLLKYRPAVFKDVVGHPEIVRSLKAAIDKGSNHTFLLNGPSGTGKTTLARIAAEELGAEVREIDAATYTGIDAMREITKTLAYRPMTADSVVIIIDECHRLSAAAWDSMLKSLEEPPGWVFWFLCTTDIAKVPKSVQTRATAYALKALPTAELVELLEYVAAEECVMEDEMGGTILRLCAKEAGGSPRQALSNMTACLTAKTREDALQLLQSASEITEAYELAQALVKGTDWDRMKELLETLKDQNPESVRHVIRSYVTKVILGSKKTPPQKLFAILEAFSAPFPSGDGMSPLVLALGSLLLAD